MPTHPDVALTPKEKRAYYICIAMQRARIPITVRKVQKCMGYKTTISPHKYLRALVDKGYMTVAPGKNATWRIFVWPTDIIAQLNQPGAALSNEPLTKAEIEHALRLAKEYGDQE